MPRIASRSLVWAFAFFLGLWVFPGQGQDAAASLGYQMLWGARENDDGRLFQSDSHRLSLDLAQDLTDRLSATEDINYNFRWEQTGTRQESVSPRASLAMSGDIFAASLSVNSLRNLNPQLTQLDSDTLGITWSSSWKKRLVPQLTANYDYSQQWRVGSEQPFEVERQGLGGQVSWDLLLARVFYAYRNDTEKLQNFETIHDSQLAKIDTGRTWGDNRLQVALGHEYSKTSDERLFDFSTTTTATLSANPTGVFVGPDTTPADFDDSPLVSAAAYLLNGTNDPHLPPAYSIVANTSNNCILLQTNGQQWDHVYLYAQDSLGNSLASAPVGLAWWFYYHDLPGTPWTLLTGVLTPTYDITNKRFVIVLPALKVAYLKVVVDLGPLAPNIDFTETQADQVVHGAIGSTSSVLSNTVNNKSNFSLDYKFNHALNFYYSLLMQKAAINGVTMTETENHNGGLRMQNSAGDLKSILSLTQSNTRRNASPDLQTIRYQLDVNKVFLPTLTVALGGSHEENFQAGVLLLDRNHYTFYADARLYPDLSSRLDVTYWEQENYNSTRGNSVSDSLHGQFSLNSRLSPSLSLAFSDIYEVYNVDKQLSKEQNVIVLSGSWQVSEWFTLHGMVQKTASNLTEDAYIYTTGMMVAFGAGMQQLEVNYSLLEAANRSQSGSALFSWGLSRNISWKVGCDYVQAEAGAVLNAYKVYSTVSVNFVTR